MQASPGQWPGQNQTPSDAHAGYAGTGGAATTVGAGQATHGRDARPQLAAQQRQSAQPQQATHQYPAALVPGMPGMNPPVSSTQPTFLQTPAPVQTNAIPGQPQGQYRQQMQAGAGQYFPPQQTHNTQQQPSQNGYQYAPQPPQTQQAQQTNSHLTVPMQTQNTNPGSRTNSLDGRREPLFHERKTKKHPNPNPGPYSPFLPEDRDWVQRKAFMDPKAMKKRKFWISWKKAFWYLVLGVICAVVILMTIYHQQILDYLQPSIPWLKEHGLWGELIVIGILFVISFPPLFGQEIVGIIIGMVWGLSIGFVLMVIGTTLGEVANYFVFKRWEHMQAAVQRYIRKMFKLKTPPEKPKSNNYGCLATILKVGSWWYRLFISTVIRFSIIPSHVSTTMFAAFGLNFWIFFASAILSTPKLILPVYIGYLLEEAATARKNSATQKDDDSTQNNIEHAVLIAYVVVSFIAIGIIGWQMYKWKYDFLNDKYDQLNTEGLPPSDFLAELHRRQSQGLAQVTQGNQSGAAAQNPSNANPGQGNTGTQYGYGQQPQTVPWPPPAQSQGLPPGAAMPRPPGQAAPQPYPQQGYQWQQAGPPVNAGASSNTQNQYWRQAGSQRQPHTMHGAHQAYAASLGTTSQHAPSQSQQGHYSYYPRNPTLQFPDPQHYVASGNPQAPS